MIQVDSTLAIGELKIRIGRGAELPNLAPDSPLYEDMSGIKTRKDKGRLEFYSHEEVWSDSL